MADKAVALPARGQYHKASSFQRLQTRTAFHLPIMSSRHPCPQRSGSFVHCLAQQMPANYAEFRTRPCALLKKGWAGDERRQVGFAPRLLAAGRTWESDGR